MIIQKFESQVDNECHFIPSTAHLCYISATIGSGKTVLMLSMLRDKEFYYQKFNNVIVINPNYASDSKWSSLIGKPVMIPNKKLLMEILKEKLNDLNKIGSAGSKGGSTNHRRLFKTKYQELISELYTLQNTNTLQFTEANFRETIDMNYIKMLIERQKSISKEYSPDHRDKILIMLDDCLAFKKVLKSEDFINLIVSLRHNNITLCIASQEYKQFPRLLRNNAMVKIYFDIHNIDILRDVWTEGAMTDNKFEVFYNNFKKAIQSKPHSFITTNLYNDMEHRCSLNFNEFIKL